MPVGRPPLSAERRRTRWINVALTPVEYQRIASAAVLSGQRPAVAVRNAALSWAGAPMDTPPAERSNMDGERRRELGALVAQVAAIGRNLNQAVRHLHQASLFGRRRRTDELQLAVESADEVCRRVERVIGEELVR